MSCCTNSCLFVSFFHFLEPKLVAYLCCLSLGWENITRGTRRWDKYLRVREDCVVIPLVYLGC